MSESEKLERILLMQDASRAENEILNFQENEKYFEKEPYKKLYITDEQMTVDNLLGIIDELENKLEKLTNEYNEVVVDCYCVLEDALDTIPNYELL